MLSESGNVQTHLNKNSIWDPVLQKFISYANGALSIHSKEGSILQHYNLYSIPESSNKGYEALRFVKKSNAGLIFSPSGKSVTCKSDSLQQIDMNMSYNSGIINWKLFCSGNCLGLTVGLKDAEKKKERCLEFTVQNPTKISLKLNLLKKQFKAWVSKSVHNVEKSVALGDKVQTWTPFVRVKGAGVSLFINDFSDDPQKQVSVFNLFGSSKLNEDQPIMQLSNTAPNNEIHPDYKISLIDEDSILLAGEKQVRVIRRSKHEKKFSIQQTSLGNQGQICVQFSQNQCNVLKEAGIKLENEQKKQFLYLTKKVEQWVQWAKHVFSYFDLQLRNGERPISTIHRAYEILLTKIESFRRLVKEPIQSISALQSHQHLSWGLKSSILPIPVSPFCISASVSLNTLPALKLNLPIREIKVTPHFMIVFFQESGRICILNRESQLFKISENLLKKGFKKEHELNEYQKQYDQLQSNDPSQPSIYKILKNCLKYADKIKPPQKILKVIEEKKEKKTKKPEKPDQIVPDKSLLNTLESMGFNSKLSKKVLVECKNISLEAAVDLIINKYNNQQIYESSSNKSWTCTVCTFINEPKFTACSICVSPKPAITEEYEKIQQEVPPVAVKIEQEVKIVESVESSNIDEMEMSKCFAWEMNLAYCPLLVAGAFKGKLRMRLFGPNPKYYSLFYNKDEQFVDLTTLNIYEEAYEISQQPIRHQYYLSTSQNQQRQSAYGWISLEDQDISYEGELKDLTFQYLQKSKQFFKFAIKVELEVNGEKRAKEYIGKIKIKSVYNDKSRAFTYEEAGEMAKAIEEPESQNQLSRRMLNSWQIPKKGFIQLNLVKNKRSKPEGLKTEVIELEVLEKINQVKPFIPVVAINSEQTQQIAYPTYPLYPGKRPLILRSLNNKQITVSCIALEKVGKSGTNTQHRGYISFISDLSKLAIRKYQFRLEKGKKKFYIDLKIEQPTIYVAIELEQAESGSDLATIEQIGIIGVIGEELSENVDLNCISSIKLNNSQCLKIEAKVQNKQTSSLTDQYKIEVSAFNYQSDLYSIPEGEREELIKKMIEEGCVDLKVKIYGFGTADLVLKEIEVEGWTIVRRESEWSIHESLGMHSSRDYTAVLDEFIKTGNVGLLDILLNEANKQFRSLIRDGNYDLTKFFKEHIANAKLQRIQKNRYNQFLKKFGPYFNDIYNAGNINAAQILKQALLNGQLSEVQLILELVKHFPCQEDILLEGLQSNLIEIKKMKKVGDKSKKSSEAIGELKMVGSQNENAIYNRFIQQKGKLYRRFIIDMISVYNVNNIALTFEKSQKRAPMLITVKSYTEEEVWRPELQILYPEYVWEQVAMCPFNDEMEKNIKSLVRQKFNTLSLPVKEGIKSRYLAIDICFKYNPNVGVAKDINKIPVSQIVPQIYGDYCGESAVSPQQFSSFQINEGLIFVQSIGSIKKYSLSSHEGKIYYYDNQVYSKESMKDSVQQLQLQKYSVTCLIVDELIARGSSKINQSLLIMLIEGLSTLDRGKLFDKVVALLKKIVKVNKEAATTAFNQKFNSESLFHSIFKDSCLNAEGIITLLAESESEILYENALFYAKGKDEKVKKLIARIQEHYLKINKIEDMLVLYEKHGWVEGTTTILDKMIEQSKPHIFKLILQSSNDNRELASYLQILLEKEEKQWFTVGFEELIRRAPKVNVEQILPLLAAFLSNIQQLSENDDSDEQEISEWFTLFAQSLNSFKVSDEEIISKFIDTFGCLSNKQQLLSKFLMVKYLKEDSVAPKLVKLCLNLLQSYMIGIKNQRVRILDDLKLVYQIFTFIFRNQTDLPFANSSMKNNLGSQLEMKAVSIFSEFILKEVCVGGQENAKIADEQTRLKISIAFCLAIFVERYSGNNDAGDHEGNNKALRNIIKWIILNSESKEEEKNPQQTHFARIETAAWHYVVIESNSNSSTVIPILSEELDQQSFEIKKVKNMVYRKIYEKKMISVCNRLIDELGAVSSCDKIIQEVLFQRIVKRIISLENDALYSSENSESSGKKTAERGEPGKKQSDEASKEAINCNEQELVNKFALTNDAAKQPKDWLVYKNGAKNHVYKFDYPKSSQQTHEIVLKYSGFDAVSLSKIIIGFEYSSNEQQTNCIPADIVVEAGSRIEEMKFIGRMSEMPDNHYISYSVRVFGLSCSQIQANKVAASLNKNPEIIYVKIKMRCPESSYITDMLNLKTLSSKNMCSSINFLSIQGYISLSSFHPEIANLVGFVKRVSSPEHKEVMKELLKQQTSVKIFKDSLYNISMLMKNENYEQILHKFIMRACEVNEGIGNETIKKYLNLSNSETCSKIVSEIILSSTICQSERVIQLHTFIQEELAKGAPAQLEPFLDRICQLLYLIARQSSKQAKAIQLEFKPEALRSIVSIKSKSIVFGKYICAILTLQAPFIAVGIDTNNIYDSLDKSSDEMNEQILQALIVSDKSARSWFMSNNKLESLYDEIIKYIEQKEGSANLTKDLKKMCSLCFNANIKSLINKNRYNLKIFELLVSDSYNQILVCENNEELREAFVEMITISVLGSQNEKVIALMLKQSLTGNVVDKNQHFVGQIFLPILNSYSKTPVCMLPYDNKEKKIIIDVSSLEIPSMRTSKPAKNSSLKFRLPSNLLSAQAKGQLFLLLKQKSKYKAGNFNIATNHGSQAVGFLQTVEKVFKKSNQPVLMMFKVKPESGVNKSQVLGIYYNDEGAERVLPLFWNKKCFMFIARQGENIEIINTNEQNGTKMLEFHNEEFMSEDSYSSFVEQKLLEISFNSVPFCEISFDIGSSYFGLDVLKGTNFGNYQLESAEYWLFEPSSVSQNQSSSDLGNSLTGQILSTSHFSFFQSSFESKSVLRLLRYDPVYEFPTSLTMREMKLAVEILKCKLKADQLEKVKFYGINLEEVSNDSTIYALMKKWNESPILDLVCEVNNLSEILDFSSSGKNKKTEYLPKKGILKHFEENNGVTSMIKVIKKSVESWSNKERREKWSQYVMQLEKFSQFPHFFGMYLKDQETFDLLFKLLSGLPDKEQDKKWDEEQAIASQKLLKIISEILSVDKTSQFREYAMKHDFFYTILERLKILTGQFKRKYHQKVEEEQAQMSPSKVAEDDGTKQIKKKKGVGYGNDGSSNTKWMKGTTQAELNKQFEVTEIILNMIENFLDFQHWKIPKKLLENIYESSLLPYLEQALRAGTLLQISKHPNKFKLVFKILRTLSKHQQLVPALMEIPQNYQPRQTESLQGLLKSLENISKIFLSCLQQNKDAAKKDKISEQLANDILETCKVVEEAVQEYLEAHQQDNGDDQIKNILSLPLDKKYRTLMKDLRFDYIDMKEGNRIKHHYSANFSQTYVPNQVKMIRLAQQLADISTALPYENTNAVYVRCDKDRVDFMQALIMGANGTPYGHGAYLFDVYFDDNYPNGPPKVNLTTTGHGKVRFNPNLYACGKVCLSLLGTWRGSASENWDAKVSTLLQVLLSIQAIIMSEEVYFNEPGFEHEQGTTEGQKKNEAYSNIVRYCNIKFAMIDNMRTPPKGFETIIRRHFYLKQHEIMEECKKWLLYAEKRPANYIGLVNDHNSSWSTEFKKSKNQYKDMLEKAISELEEQFKKLPAPSISDIVSKVGPKKQKKKKKETDLLKKLEEKQEEEIDVTYETKDIPLGKEIDINDEKVKDRWSRYIGAMGIDAVSKQSKADILVFGLGPMALEVVKNLVLSGCHKLTLCDDSNVTYEDLSGGFFYSELDVGKNKVESVLHKIRELNVYVKIDHVNQKDITEDILKTYHLVLATDMQIQRQFEINQQCRKHNVKFISAECRGAFCRLLNDFGDKFEVLDKNGEEPIQVFIKSITSSDKAVVTLLDGVKNPYEDGEAVLIKQVQGMNSKEDPKKSINETIHKIKVINSKSFEIGDTTGYEPYIRNGSVKNIKTPVLLKFRSMKQVFESKEELPLDENMQFYDFVKIDRNKLIHSCFLALNEYVKQNKQVPQPWNLKNAEQFVKIFLQFYADEVKPEILQYAKKFSFTCSGNLPPLLSFFGGFVAQQVVKAITQKYKPLHSTFFLDAQEIIPPLPENEENWEKFSQSVFSDEKNRERGFEIVVGKDLLKIIKNVRLFMIGAGAIGCQLLKNFAMINLGTGQSGKITLTDPDHIENSNLNRQFLFREKHISKPKSRTAAASILLMNPNLKGHISALLERVSDSTKNIFTNNFFESLTIVANALDNVAARRYVDQRCVENKVPLFQSGTLGPKGHTQVIIPYKTESYGSQSDPVEDGQIPHCTLKMFPEETLHCVEWARDIFGKKFSLQPKAFIKFKDSNYKPEKDDIKGLNECLLMAEKGPKTFEDCISYATTKFYKYFRDDIIQLLYTYPLDAKTKDGEPFWKLPKRPPTPIMKLDPENSLHSTFISSMAVMVAKIYKIPYPKNFRQQKQRLMICKQAAKVKISDYVPSDEKAKAILKESADEKKKGEEKGKEEEKEEIVAEEPETEIQSDRNQQDLFKEFLETSKQVELAAEQFEKDDDKNGHIDFIYSMANLRAENYKLDNMDWITTKLKAGRIVPALSTTTTCVAGLQTLEMCKYLCNLKLQKMRNSFLNLAVPSLQMSEPGEVKKINLTEKTIVSLWDRWQVQCTEQTTFGQVYKELSSRYDLNPIGVLQGMSRIDTNKSETGQKQFLNSKILDRLDKEDDYIDIVVLFTKTNKDEKLLENVPPVRLTFKK